MSFLGDLLKPTWYGPQGSLPELPTALSGSKNTAFSPVTKWFEEKTGIDNILRPPPPGPNVVSQPVTGNGQGLRTPGLYGDVQGGPGGGLSPLGAAQAGLQVILQKRKEQQAPYQFGGVSGQNHLQPGAQGQGTPMTLAQLLQGGR